MRNGSGRRPLWAATDPGSNAVPATARQPEDALKPSAKPRRSGPARTLVMSTVGNQGTPRPTPTTSDQYGAQLSSNGTGIATNHPATSTGLRPYLSDQAPAT